MTAAELLTVYKAQPHLERRHATFKGVLEAVPVELHSDYRIDALGFCLYAALLTHALIERELRLAVTAAGITDRPMYHEHRACKAPSAARVLDLLAPLTRTPPHPHRCHSRRPSSHRARAAPRSSPTPDLRPPRYPTNPYRAT